MVVSGVPVVCSGKSIFGARVETFLSLVCNRLSEPRRALVGGEVRGECCCSGLLENCTRGD